MKTIYYFLVFSAICANSQKLVKLWETKPVLKTPESAIFHKESGKIFVSNISGEAWAYDKDGFLSILDKDGNIENLKWVVNFDAPKGMGIVGDNLYVADINKIRVVSISKGAIIEEFEIEEAYNLNDIAVSDDGIVYVSDSHTPVIYELINGKVTKWYSNKSMEMINGLDWDSQGLVVLEMKNGKMSHVTNKKHHRHIVDNLHNADGVVTIGQDEYLVSNWEGVIYHVKDKVVKELINTSKEKVNAADICYIPGKNILLVPTFHNNKVVAYKLTR